MRRLLCRVAGRGSLAVCMGAVVACGCEGSRSASSSDTPQPPPSPAGELPATASAAASQSAPTPPPSVAASTTAAAAEETGSLLVEGIVVHEPKIGRPGPEVLVVAIDPRYQLAVRVLRVEPEADEDFPVGKPIVLGIHSPSRTFLGGVRKGQKVRLRIHWRQPDGGPRHYFHVQREQGEDGS